jgi:hypothetical protein
MKQVAFFVLLCAVGTLPSQSAAQKPSSTGLFACAAFSRQGDLAEITVGKGALDLLIVRTDGTRQSSQDSVSADEHHYEAFFTADSSVLAVSSFIGTYPENRTVRVRIWNLKSAAWQARFDVNPRKGLEGSLGIEGFWNGGPDLMVESVRLKDATHSVMALALVDISGKIVAGPRPRDTARALDAERGGAWLPVPGSGTDCFRSAETFASNNAGAPAVKPGVPTAPCRCFAGGLHGFAGGKFVVGASGKGNSGTRVWSCALAGEPQKLSLPPPPKQFLDSWVESGPADLAVSPHGTFFGVVVEVTRWNHFDTQRAEWNELHVFQTSPLREIGKLGPIKRCGALLGFAVGDADGEARVAVNWCGKWSTETVSGITPAPRR